jgi:methyl-accepting chemotaxis protein
MEGLAKPFRRTKYLIAARFQMKYVGLVLLIMFLTFTLCSIVIYFTMMGFMGEKLARVYPQGRLIYLLNVANLRMILTVLLLSPLIFILGIFLSHRIAGPIYRMEKFLKGVSVGDVSTRITLRKKDELVTLADSMNSVADSIQEAVSDEKSHARTALDEIARLKQMVDSKSTDHASMAASVNKINGELEDLKKTLDKYRMKVGV